MNGERQESLRSPPAAAEAHYDLGYCDALLQSVFMAGIRSGMSLVSCRELVVTALDAHANIASRIQAMSRTMIAAAVRSVLDDLTIAYSVLGALHRRCGHDTAAGA